MKIGIYILSHLNFAGGGERSAFELASYLSEIGEEVTLRFASNNRDISRFSDSDFPEIHKFKYEGKEFLRFPVLPISKQLFHPLPQLSDLAEADINLIFIFRMPPISYLRELTRMTPPTVFLLHGISIEEKSPLNLKVFLYNVFLRLMVLWSIRQFQRGKLYIICITKNLARKLENFGINREKILPVALKTVKFEKYSAIQNDNVFRIVFLGRSEKLQKGLGLLRNIITCLSYDPISNLEFVIVGSGTDSDFIRSFSEAFEFVRFLGFVDEDEKVSLLSSSNLMVITSYIEPWGLVVLEGIASGLPVLTTPVVGPKEIISASAELGKVLSFNAYNFVQSIREYYRQWEESKVEYFSKRKRIRQIGGALFSSADTWQKYHQFIRSIVNRSDN